MNLRVKLGGKPNAGESFVQMHAFGLQFRSKGRGAQVREALVLRRRHAALLAEMAVEVGNIGVTNLKADVGDRASSVRKKFARPSDAQLRE